MTGLYLDGLESNEIFPSFAAMRKVSPYIILGMEPGNLKKRISNCLPFAGTRLFAFSNLKAFHI